MERLTVEVNGLRFEMVATGPLDGEVVMCLHGFPEFADSWVPVMERLAASGYRAAAFDQRGYSRGARPAGIDEYVVERLLADVAGVVEAMGTSRIHLAGHDWGGLLAWQFAARHPERLRTVTVLSTPHPDALFDAIEMDADQREKSRYIEFFRMPGGAAEAYFQADGWAALRRMYQGKVSEQQVEQNVQRLSEPGALTAALNWYRALKREKGCGAIRVPALYVWGSEDMALGRAAAVKTGDFVKARYQFEVLDSRSHWLPEEAPDAVAELLLAMVRSKNVFQNRG